MVGYLRCLGTILSALACLFCARLTAAEPFVLAGSGDEELVVYSTADYIAVEPVLRAYKARRPELTLIYHELLTQELHARVLNETGLTADVVWSSAMDLQMKLVHDGYARRFMPLDEE